MGGLVSSLNVALKTLRELNASYAAVISRINGSPGKPVANPTVSAWQLPPSPLAGHKSETMPDEVDVLIMYVCDAKILKLEQR